MLHDPDDWSGTGTCVVRAKSPERLRDCVPGDLVVINGHVERGAAGDVSFTGELVRVAGPLANAVFVRPIKPGGEEGELQPRDPDVRVEPYQLR